MPAAVLPSPPTEPLEQSPAPTFPLRPRRHLAWIALALFATLWFVSWFGLLGELEVSIGAQPITVELRHLDSPSQVAVTYTTTVGDTDGDQKLFGFVIPHEELMFPSPDRATWTIGGHWIKTLHITAPERVLQQIHSVDIRIGDRRQTGSNLASWKRIDTPLTGLLPNRSEPAVTLELPADPTATLPAINSVPMASFVQSLFAFPLVGFAIALAVAWLLIRFAGTGNGIALWQTLATPSNPASRATAAWFWAGLALCAAGIGMLYARSSYPFTQDDNFSQFLPMVLYNCQALLSGQWPAWNPHQFLGAPVATMGIYSVTYPPVYLAYAIAKLAGHPYWTIEIYTLLHLAAGYVLLNLFLRRQGIRDSIAAVAAASFVLSGWFLIAGPSQMTFAPLAVWPVALAWSLHHLMTTRRATWTWSLLTALSVGLFFHAGHSQMWVYGMMFYAAGVGIYWLAGRLNWRDVAAAVPALLIGIALAAPLLILQAIEGTSSARSGAYGDRIEFLHMLLPLGSLFPRPVGLGTAGYQYFCEMYYSGTLFQALCFAALLMAVARLILAKSTWKETRTWLGQNAWLVLFALAILFGLGSKGVLWTLFSQLPIFDRFRWPIKFAYFCLLYSTLAGAILAERWFTAKPKLHYPALAAVACLLLVHVNLSRTTWYDFADRPYPKLPDFVESNVTHRGRLLTRWGSMDRSPLPGYYNSLPLDFATHAGAYAVGGYDTFLEGSLAARRVRYKFWSDPVAAARAYGVRWILADSTLDHPVASANPFFSSLDAPSIGNVLAIHATQDAARLTGRQNALTLHELPDPDPLAFIERGGVKLALPIQLNPQGAVIDTAQVQPGETLTCNIALRPWITAATSSEPAMAPTADSWGRVRLQLNRPAQRVEVHYSAPWPKTLTLGALLALLGAGLHLWLQAQLRRNHQAEPDQP